MADRVKESDVYINRKTMEIIEGKRGTVIADVLNADRNFLKVLREHMDDNQPAVFVATITANGVNTDSNKFGEGHPGRDFGYSWLVVVTTDSHGVESGSWYWLKDLFRKPTGEYCVYQCSVVTEGNALRGTTSSEDGVFGMGRPDKPNKIHIVDTDTKKSYIGITKQTVWKRWKQHIYEAQKSRRYLFHRFLRKQIDLQSELTLYFRVLRAGLSFDEAMQAEEDLVAATTLFPHGLNMIPGGHAGLRYLAERNFKTNAKRMIENRAGELSNFFSRNPNNPLLALRMQSDDELISRIICKNPRNFGLSEVRHIRAMAELGYTEEEIAEEVKASQQRIHNLLTAKTYSRVA